MSRNAFLAITPGAQRANRSRSFAGAITLLALLTFFTVFTWLLMAPQFFLLQLPLLLGAVFLLLFFGLGYFLNPPEWTGAFLMALLYLAQDFTVRQGLVGGGGVDLQSLVKGGIAALLMGYGLFNGATRVARQPVLWLFFAYAAFGLFSASYSSARALGIGSGFALLGIAFATARAATSTQKDLKSYWYGLYIVAVVLCVSSLLLLATVPLMARDLADPGAYRLRGLTGSANSLGPIMALGIIAGLMLIKQAQPGWRKNMHRLFWVAMVVALVLTNSRSTLLGLILGLAAVEVVLRRQTILTILLTLLGGALFLTVVALPSLAKGLLRFVAENFSRSGSTEEITNFTGRSEIWEACWGLIKDKPWQGYGLGSVRIEIPKVFYDEWGNTAATAHNFVLESLISVGVIGTSLLLAVVLMSTVGLTRMVTRSQVLRDDDQRDMAVCALRCMFMLLIHAMVERAFAGMAAPSTVLLGVCVATYAFFAIQQSQDQRVRHQRIMSLR